jgi:hypothetical protein
MPHLHRCHRMLGQIPNLHLSQTSNSGHKLQLSRFRPLPSLRALLDKNRWGRMAEDNRTKHQVPLTPVVRPWLDYGTQRAYPTINLRDREYPVPEVLLSHQVTARYLGAPQTWGTGRVQLPNRDSRMLPLQPRLSVCS